MDNIINCENKFKNLRMINTVKRQIRDSGCEADVTVTYYPDDSSPTGVGLVLVTNDGYTKQISSDIINNLLTR